MGRKRHGDESHGDRYKHNVPAGLYRICTGLEYCLKKSMSCRDGEEDRVFDMPEKILLLAMLDRAARDVLHMRHSAWYKYAPGAELQAKKDALEFFWQKKRVVEEGFIFPEVCDYLGIHRGRFLDALDEFERFSNEEPRGLPKAYEKPH